MRLEIGKIGRLSDDRKFIDVQTEPLPHQAFERLQEFCTQVGISKHDFPQVVDAIEEASAMSVIRDALK